MVKSFTMFFRYELTKQNLWLHCPYSVKYGLLNWPITVLLPTRYEILFIRVRWRLPSTKEAEESTKKIAMAKEGQLLLHTCRLLTHAVHKNYPELFLFFFLQRDESCRDMEETDSNDLKTRYLQKQLNNLREKVKLFTEHDLNVQVIDSRCRILFPLTFAIVNIIYWIYFIFDSKRS